METFEQSRVHAYFRRVTNQMPASRRPAVVLVTHLLPERPLFVTATARLGSLAAMLPKPKSADPAALAEVALMAPCDVLDRHRLSQPDHAVAYLESRAAGRDLVILDVGGYFAPALETVCESFSGRVLGVVEDTENGLRRYLSLPKLPCPVFSVARSPLKDPEDFLVGQSVVFSAEALIRARGDIMQGRPACVIGFGKVGSSIARMLHAKNVPVTVYDTDPVRMAQALAQGFRTAGRVGALAGAGIVVCATGNLALTADDFPAVPNGSYIASVTSADDELDLTGLASLYEQHPAGQHVTRYSTTGHYFYVLNSGNAVNFLHGACVGPFIYLVQAEILAALSLLAAGDREPGLHECPGTIRQSIAATWLKVFNGES